MEWCNGHVWHRLDDAPLSRVHLQFVFVFRLPSGSMQFHFTLLRQKVLIKIIWMCLCACCCVSLKWSHMMTNHFTRLIIYPAKLVDKMFKANGKTSKSTNFCARIRRIQVLESCISLPLNLINFMLLTASFLFFFFFSFDQNTR